MRDRVIRALESGTVQHEARGDIDEKNLLLVGDVTIEEVVALLKRCKGTQYELSAHHQDATVEVHIFKPQEATTGGRGTRRWYIKLYFIDPDVWFISVHHGR